MHGCIGCMASSLQRSPLRLQLQRNQRHEQYACLFISHVSSFFMDASDDASFSVNYNIDPEWYYAPE
jgi:hypothetical protein